MNTQSNRSHQRGFFSIAFGLAVLTLSSTTSLVILNMDDSGQVESPQLAAQAVIQAETEKKR